MAKVKFYCTELGKFTLSQVPTYRAYKKLYPDMIMLNPDGSIPMIQDKDPECIIADILPYN